MKQKHTLTLDNEFIEYCKLNNITDIDKKAKEVFSRGFTILKFGETPSGSKTIEKIEVIKEVIVEVPVEVIKEVTKPGKTKTITKEVINNKLVEELQKENERLNNELNQITDALTKASKMKVMKNSDLSNLYDE